MQKRMQYIAFSVILAAALIIGISQIFGPELDRLGHYTLMMLIITIGLWIFRPFHLPFSVSGILFMAGMLVFGVPAATVFAGFAGSAVWTLIPALFFGYALSKTGLGRRIAYLGMKSIKATYPNLILMWMLIGMVLSLLTPSIIVRVVIVTPIALQCVDVCQLAKGSKGRSLILLTAWAMAVIPGGGWLTGALTGPILSGLYASVPGLGAISFQSWAQVALLPMLLITILSAVGGYFVLKPAGQLGDSRDVFAAEYHKLGKMSFREKVSAVVLTTCFIMFLTSSRHHIPDGAVCLGGLFALTVFGVIEVKEISTGINWDLVIFIGTAMGFGSVFSYTGLSAWMAELLIELIAPVAGHPWLFVLTVLLFFFLWRFVDIATFVPSMAVISAIAPEVFSRYRIDPLIWVPLLCIAVNSFFLSYTNMFALVAEANLGEEGWTSRHLTMYGVVYGVAAFVTMLVCIPYWIHIGMFGSINFS